MTPGASESDPEHIVKSADPARYFANQFVPVTHRSDMFVLHAFDLEIRKITRTVREPMAGEIRLQWWREVLQGSRNAEAAASPLASAVLEFTQRHSISSQIWDNYLDGRIFDLYDDAVEDQAAFEAYAGQTEGTMLQLACLVLDRGQSSSAAQVSGFLSCAMALWDRALRPMLYSESPAPAHLISNIAGYLPPQLRQDAGLQSNPYLGAETVDSRHALSEICAATEAYLEKARMAADAVPATLHPAFLHTAPMVLSLSKLRHGDELKLPLSQTSRSRLIWHLWRRSKRWPCF